MIYRYQYNSTHEMFIPSNISWVEITYFAVDGFTVNRWCQIINGQIKWSDIEMGAKMQITDKVKNYFDRIMKLNVFS